MRDLHLALVWHMHQPYYKDDLTSTYLLPWVRLRSAKDYHKMPALLDAYPGIKQTFNLVPSLLAQIEDLARGEHEDLFLNLSRKPAADLTAEESDFILRWMREPARFLRVQSSPRYVELAGRSPSDGFSVDDLRDLQVWFNLAWCDPAWVDSDPRLAELKRKDRGFLESDKAALFEAQAEIIAQVIPKYRELADRGQAELIFSPFYHPILPLICHVDSARTASPQIRLPQRHFSHREDAERQIDLGMTAFERLLGRRPRGMWPPEMAVGESVASLAARAGIDWFISDEEVLARSLETYLGRDSEGRLNQPDVLYRPYRMEREGREVSIVFRDATLSNLIGFDYHRMHAADAARDFVRRLRDIRDRQGERDFLVTVALDGENAWEFYSRDGHDFLNALYTELEAAEGIVSTTVGDFLRKYPERAALHRLHTGSWIGANLDTWVGDPEHNLAWDLLAQTRQWLEDYSRHHPAESEPVAAAWREIMITEGSDWFWWFSRKHDSGMDAIWDNQFRLHLRNVYKLVGAKPPARLFQPIIARAPTPEKRLPGKAISPAGAADPAWEDAGWFDVSSGFGALHRPVGLVERVLYGSDEERLYSRIDSPLSGPALAESGVTFWLYFSGVVSKGEPGPDAIDLPLGGRALADLGFEPAFVARITPRAGGGGSLMLARVLDSYRQAEAIRELELEDPSYLALEFADIDKRGGEPMEIALVVVRDGQDVEQVPPFGSLGLRVPRRGGLVEALDTSQVRVLIAASECAPFAKSGGIADVVPALAKSLKRLGHDVRVVIPRYRTVGIDRWGLTPAVRALSVPLGSQVIECTVLEGRLEASEVPIYFIDCPQLFDRDGLYGFGDDDARFIYLSRALIEMLQPLGWSPDVVHCHDWHTALVPNLLDRLYSDESRLAAVASVLTIHNLAFQGSFGYGTLSLAGLEPWGLMQVGIPHLDQVVNLLGRGIHYSDVFNTVSERYAEEMQTPELGEGMDQLVRAHAHKLYGIVNGIDTDVFNPETDPALPNRYSVTDTSGKALDKSGLRVELGLAAAEAPLIAVISRFYEQKGLDLIEQAMPALVGLGVQLAVLGTGDRRYEDMARYQAAKNPGQVAAVIGFDAGLAQRMYAGADMFLMPSRFEPCGLGQLISLRYGTIPVVRATGGLADTISDFDPSRDDGTGFVFDAFDPWQMFAAVVRAAETYKHAPIWTRLVRRAMEEDVSWTRSAERYVQLYQTAMVHHRESQGTATVGSGRA